MRTSHTKCLLLNIDYSPITLMSWKRAIIWNFKYEDNNNYGIEILDFYKNDHINGVHNKKFPIPAVARTKRFFKTNLNHIVFSRKNIFVRDEYTCQYCSKKLDYNKLTYDHVIPKSANGPTNWTNIVTSCAACNLKKGNRTPKQANMTLLKQPVKPNQRLKYSSIYEHICNMNYLPKEWEIYLT